MPTKCKDPYALVYVGLAELNESMRTHAADVPHLEMCRVRLEGMLTELNDLKQLQLRLKADSQETTRRIEELLDQLCKLGNFTKVGLKEHFGTTNEKLAAFGLQPFRGRRRRAAEAKATEPAEGDTSLTAPAAPEQSTP